MTTPLTAREQLTLLRIAEGTRHSDLAAEWHVSESAISTAAATIRDKLGVETMPAAVYTACRLGLLPLDGPAHREEEPTDPAPAADDPYRYALGAKYPRTYPRTSKEN